MIGLDTRIDLVKELEKVEQTDLVKEIIEEAKRGEYHDYRSPHVCGKVYAVSRLMKAGLVELADRIKNGDFDEKCTEDDEKFILNDIANDPTMTDEQKKQFSETFTLLGKKIEVEKDTKLRKLMIVIEETGLSEGNNTRPFIMYLDGDKDRLSKIPENQYTAAEFYGKHLFSMCAHALKEAGMECTEMRRK